MTSKLKIHFKHFVIGSLIAALGAGTYVIAAVTFSDFTSGTTISAAEMNAKLNALKNAVNASAASVTCPANTPTRFTDNGDGTVCDSQTGLMWEKKTGTVGTRVICSTPTDCPDPQNVNNRYTWSAVSPNPDGTLFTNFLTKINRGESVATSLSTVTQAGYTDWRIPNIVELRSILLAPNPCGTNPCIDPVFGSMQAFLYWSSSSVASFPPSAWRVDFSGGADVSNTSPKSFDGGSARAVRGGR